MLTKKIQTDEKVSGNPHPITQENCPARCKKSGLCYGKAWFLAKPGPAAICNRKLCRWKEHMQELS